MSGQAGQQVLWGRRGWQRSGDRESSSSGRHTGNARSDCRWRWWACVVCACIAHCSLQHRFSVNQSITITPSTSTAVHIPATSPELALRRQPSKRDVVRSKVHALVLRALQHRHTLPSVHSTERGQQGRRLLQERIEA